MGIVRWDPASRAGAVAVRVRKPLDCQAVSAVSDAVRDWADYQNLSGEVDTVETSTIQGAYNWRSYIQEEAAIARRRDEERAKGREKRVERAAPSPVPLQLYS